MIFDTLCIVPTRNCNSGNCTYCHVLKDKSKFTFGPREKNILKKMIPHLKAVKFFGGEPLLTEDLCFEMISYIRDELSFSGEINMNTNLLTMNKNILLRLQNFDVNIYYSLDGHVRTVKTNRNISEENLKKTYENFALLNTLYPQKRLINNFVLSPQSIEYSYSDFLFLIHNGATRINLLPAMYVPWRKKEIHQLNKTLKKITYYALAHKEIMIENVHIHSLTPLFNNYFLWDTDQKFYPSMFVMEKFCSDKSSLEIDPFSFTQKDFLTFQKKIDKMILASVPKESYESTLHVSTLLNCYVEDVIHYLSPQNAQDTLTPRST